MILRTLVRTTLALSAAAFALPAFCLPTFEESRKDFASSETIVVDRNGEFLQRMRTDNTVRRGAWIPLSDISPALRAAMVLSEDKRFYEHSGVDWRAVSAAAWGNLLNTKTRGASTITMQLAGLLDDDLRQTNGGRNVVQKLGQTVSAQVLDRRWRKDQILEAYLNLVPFRGEIVGIDALSQTMFGKAAHGLDDREAAVAAALVRAPNAKAAQVSRRACSVLVAMSPGPQGSRCDGLDLFTEGALQRREFDASEGIAPHAARFLLKTAGKPQARIVSTLRAPLQRQANELLNRHLRELPGRHVDDGAVVVLDNATGEVLAWVGSSGELSRASQVDAAMSPRQAGSTLKPFLYAQAIAEKRITAASLLDDSPASIQTTSGLYIPQNYDKQFKGWVSARTALASSLNVPAVRTLTMVSPDAFFRQLTSAGLPLMESGDYYGFSLALGSAEVTLMDLTNAYRTLANSGVASPVVTVVGDSKAPKSKPHASIDSRATFIVGDMLSDPMARARTFGTDSVLATRFWTAVKTGTSKDMRDNWAVGWSQKYTVGVWVGNANGAPMWEVSGTSGAAPVWADVMKFLHARERSNAPRAPAGVVAQQVKYTNGAGFVEASRNEYFIDGTQQAVFAMSTSDDGFGTKLDQRPAAITSPTNGTIVAIDPDIPPNRQRIQFASQGADVQWSIDGKHFAVGSKAAWMPWPGRHTIQLRDKKGNVVDEVRVEVRGASVKSVSDTKPEHR